jgi:hypothetical protein
MRLILLALVPACAVSTTAPFAHPRPAPAPAPASDPAPASAPAAEPRMGKMTCDAAHDHCIRPDTWFMTNPDSMYPDATPAYEDGGAFYTWERKRPIDGEAHRTVAATADNVTVGAAIVVFDSTGVLPYSEDNALSHDWRYGTIAAVDGDAVQLVDDSTWIPIDAMRVVVESR